LVTPDGCRDDSDVRLRSNAAALEQIVGAIVRIAVSRWSNERGDRIAPLRELALVTAATLLA